MMFDAESFVRTTLTIDDDVLTAAKAIAEMSSKTIGEVVSELARGSLQPRAPMAQRNGVPLLRAGKKGRVVTLHTVNALRDEAP